MPRRPGAHRWPPPPRAWPTSSTSSPTTLAGEIRRTGEETSKSSRTQLDAAVQAVTDAAATVTGTTEVTPRVDLAIAAIGEVRQELAAVSHPARPHRPARRPGRVGRPHRRPAGPVGRRRRPQVREAIAEREAADDLTPALDAMRADLRHAVRALTTEQPGALDRLPAAVDAITQDLAGLTARLDEVRARTEVSGRDLGSAWPTSPPPSPSWPTDLAALATLPASIDGLGGAVEGAVAVHRRSAAAVETCNSRSTPPRADIGAAAGATQHLEQRLDAATAAMAAANQETLTDRPRPAAGGRRPPPPHHRAAGSTALAGTLDALAARPAPETGRRAPPSAGRRPRRPGRGRHRRAPSRRPPRRPGRGRCHRREPSSSASAPSSRR